MDTNDITVIIPTFNRPEILSKTVDLITENLHYYDGYIKILIGDDGNGYIGLTSWDSMIEVIRGPHKGLGANLNMLLRAAETEVVLQMDDDHHLKEVIDVTYHVRTLLNPPYESPRIGWIRLFMGEAKDYNNWRTYYKFLARMVGPYWRLYPRYGELYVSSNRPHLKLVSMHTEHYGWYPENVKLGETETMFCHQFAERYTDDKPFVGVPMFLQDCWTHVGDSWQKRGL